MKLKKLLALILALMMAVCVFAACSDDTDTSKDEDDEKQEEKADKNDKKEPEKEPEKKPAEELSDEDAVKAVVNEFSDLYFAGDEKALDYVDKEAKGYETIKKGIEEQQSMREKFTGMASSFGLPEEYIEEVEKMGNEFADDVFGKMKITVNKVEVNGDEAVAKCTFESPDFDNMEGLMNEEILNEAMSSAFTEEEIEEINNADEKTQMEASVKLIDAVLDLMAEKLEATSEDLDYNLKKVDGNWIIVGQAE